MQIAHPVHLVQEWLERRPSEDRHDLHPDTTRDLQVGLGLLRLSDLSVAGPDAEREGQPVTGPRSPHHPHDIHPSLFEDLQVILAVSLRVSVKRDVDHIEAAYPY